MSRPLTNDEKGRAHALLLDGASYHEVGRTIGRSDDAIRKNFPGYGWTKTQGQQFREWQRRFAELGR